MLVAEVVEEIIPVIQATMVPVELVIIPEVKEALPGIQAEQLQLEPQIEVVEVEEAVVVAELVLAELAVQELLL